MSRREGDRESRAPPRRELERARRTGKKPGGTGKEERPRLAPGDALTEAVVEGRGPR